MPQPTIVVSVNAAWNLVNFRASLLRGLVTSGYRVVAIAPPDGREIDLATIGVEFEPISIDRRGMSPLADARLLWSYVRILRRLSPAAYLGFTIKPNVYGGLACRILGIPRIANIAGLGTSFLKRGLLNHVVRQLYAAGLHGAERVFFQNRDDQGLFVAEGLVELHQAALLPGSGVDLVRFAPRSRQPDGSTVFLLVTRLLQAKGVAEFVEASSILRARHGVDIRCRILGIRDHSAGGIDAATLERWAQAGQVEFIEAREDVRPVLADADCVVLPSYYPEGTPRSLLEALAMAKAIITTDTPGCRDVVDDGLNGFLCRPRNVSSLVDAMERYRLLGPEDRAVIAQASRAKAVGQFDETLVIDAYRAALTDFASTSVA
ncbi:MULTISPECIES: glycosyltransferase family 4 protein [unclassified Sphingomonas]|uniref:glycosyltransferase family 4 protein n=1 Tax=unclassified Sphingomonas TaxID=196159 RepID=UPI00226BA242|nr:MULTISPECIES: glycosyltransferase family 4 protein [unclassified Sphingomonas]